MIHEKFTYNTSDSDTFYGQGPDGIKCVFQHLSTGRTYYSYGVFTDLSLNTKTSIL